VLDELQLDAI
jgi:hypothetical protein